MFVQVMQEVLAPLYWVFFALPNMSKCGHERWLVGLFLQLTKREGSTMKTPMPRIAISSGPSARLVLPNMSISSTISRKVCLLVELSRLAKFAFLHVRVSWSVEQIRQNFLERDGHCGIWRQNVQRQAYTHSATRETSSTPSMSYVAVL